MGPLHSRKTGSFERNNGLEGDITKERGQKERESTGNGNNGFPTVWYSRNRHNDEARDTWEGKQENVKH